MNVTTRIIKNSGLLILASIINNLMTFILTLFTARYLGTYDYGIISSATSLVGVFGIFCDLGLATYAIREVSRDKQRTSVYFGTVFFLRVVFSLITLGIYTIFILISHFNPVETDVMLLFGLYMVFNSLTLCLYSLFQSNEKMEYQTIGNVIYSVSVLLIILLLIYIHGDVKVVASGYPIAIVLSFSYSLYITYKHYPKLSISFDKLFIKELFVKGIPFGITSVFTSIYFWIALILLTFLSGSYAVGLFSSSQKLLLVFSAIFTLISNAIFPVMSDLYIKNRDELANVYHKLMKYMLILGLPIAIGSAIYSKDIIYIIYGSEYVVGANALTILIWAGVFMFLSSTCSTLLGAINKQFTATKIAAIGAMFSVVLNTFMIMKFSYIGASISTVCTEFVILLLMLLTLRRTEYSISPRKSVKPVIQIVIANIIMTIAIVYPHLTFLVAVPVAAMVYVVALLITGGINREDREIVLDFIDKFRNRNR
jgi:O-antigen/teichoic acid export membrane protein